MADSNGQRPARPRRLSRRAIAELKKPLDETLVSERTNDGGDLVRYLEGHTVIEQANSIFGFDAWGAEVVGEVAFKALRFDSGPDGTQAVGMYAATVRVRVVGCPPHSDVGCAFVADRSPDAYATAYKAAVTDALKRSLRHFGSRFGNDLYQRRDDQTLGTADGPPGGEHVADELTAEQSEELRRQVLTLASQGGTDETNTREWVSTRYGCTLDELDGRPLQDAVGRLSAGLNRRNGHAQAA